MQLLNRADNPKLVSKIAVKWTKGQTLLTKKLLQYILQSELRIDEGEEATAVEKIIRNDLLEEFKQDELTLGIRQGLYTKDLENLLELRESDLQTKDRIYLLKIQRRLGLGDIQVRAINDRYLGANNYFSLGSNSDLIDYKNRKNRLSVAARINSIDWELTDICEQSDIIVQPTSELDAAKKTRSSFWQKFLLLFLWTSFLLLSFKAWNYWYGNERVVWSNNSNSEQQKLCVDLASRQSSRMSLGEKLLTKKYDRPNSASMIPLYEGMAAFARCEFSLARDKYRQSLAVDRNNPEALIYQNNALAIAGEHFKIAVSVPLGSKPNIAWEILRGVAQAQTQFNRQGGIDRKLLLVQVVNDDNDPDVVQQVAKELAKDPKILAVVGHNDSNSSLAGAKVYQKEKLVMISPTSTSTKLSGIGSHIMRTIPSVSALASKLADYAATESLTEIAICADSQDSASESFAGEFISRANENGIKITDLDCDLARQDLQPSSMVNKATAQSVDALLLAPSVNKMSQAIAIAQANQQKLPLLGNHSLYTYQTIKSGQSAIAGMVLPSPWLSDNEEVSSFSQTAMQYWGGKVNWRTAMAHDATGAIIQGLLQSSDRSSLQSVLAQPDFMVNGATGRFHFQQGDRLGKIELAYIKRLNGDRPRYQFARLEL
ncbi:MAG: ABC transporter substrate-binding protein [Cyanobacteria bacterium P01_G01_bin.19]